MELVGGIFDNEQDLTLALQALSEKGFVAFEVFGPDELFRQGVIDEEMAESLESQQHTAMGSIGGISVNARPYIPDEPSARPISDDLMQLGLPEEVADEFVAGIQQDGLLLMLRTKAARAAEAQEILEENSALTVHSVHPEDAFPEEQSRGAQQ
ncbi:MAG TPA: hypothetical protein VK879_19435 [Candidatus Sulfomarinibacteraceae bacterium]|nr:hypothetical protein [Candidatus Sulfomarinibacteraceae bacterium]